MVAICDSLQRLYQDSYYKMLPAEIYNSVDSQVLSQEVLPNENRSVVGILLMLDIFDC